MNPDQLLEHFHRIGDAPEAIPRLRRFILDLAVRGKLVPQDRNDEPASELLKRIAAEKARLVKAGELRKDKPSAPIRDEELPLSLPKNWAWLRLHEIGLLSGGMTPSMHRSDFWDGDIVWLSPKDIKADEVSDSELKITAKGLSETRLVTYRPGSLFMVARSGILKRIFPVSINRVPAAANQDMKVLVPFLGGQERYLQIMFWGLTDFILRELVKTGTTVQSLKYAEFEEQPFPLPPLAEQRRIVAKVGELMALCDRLEAAWDERETTRDRLEASSLARLNAPDPDPAIFADHARFALNNLVPLTTRPDQVEQLRQTILNLAVRGKLVPQDPKDEPASQLLKCIAAEKARLVKTGEIKNERPQPPLGPEQEPFDLPVSWNWSRLRSLCSTLGDGLHGTPTYSDGGKCYFINGNNLENGKIVIKANTKTVSFDEMQKYKKPLTNETVLVSINGTLGNVAFYDNEQIILGKSACYFNLTAFTDKNFARIVLESPYFTSYAFQGATGTTIMNLSLKAMNEFPFPLPPLAEQRRIVAKVDELMALCGRLEESLAASNNTRRRLLDALIAGALAPGEMQQQAA